jgi:RNA polymerase-binding transcription factor DksA
MPRGRRLTASDGGVSRWTAVAATARGSVAQVTDWTPAAGANDAAPIDLDDIERELDGVEVALGRLDAGTYWTDESTGEPLPDELLEADPTARRLL